MFNPGDLLKSLLSAKQYSQDSHEKVKSTCYDQISNVDFHTINTQHKFTDYFKKVYNDIHSDHSSMFGSGSGKDK